MHNDAYCKNYPAKLFEFREMQPYILGMEQPTPSQEPLNIPETTGREPRISNILSRIETLVHLKPRTADVDDAPRILLDTAGRIDAVARLLRLLVHDDETPGIPIEAFLDEVCAAMESVAVDDHLLHVSVDCPGDLILPRSVALRLGLLTAELFANSLSYAHPTRVPTIIRVACSNGPDGMFTFTFEDDGVGFPEGFDPKQDGGLGMRLLDSLSAELGGRCEWQDLGIGLRFVVRFPAGQTLV